MGWTLATEVTGAWIGPDAPTDMALVGTWVDKAERLIRSKVPDIQARIDAATETDLLSNVQDIVVAMVQRVFRNPEGVRQRQEGTGPFTGSVTYGGDQPGALWITDAELGMLSVAGSAGGAFTIDMIPASSPFSSAYVSPLNAWETA